MRLQPLVFEVYSCVCLTRCAALSPATGYTGGYFRYGSLSWQQTKIEADGISVKFTLKTAWARAMFSRGEADTPWGNCVECSGAAINAARECDNTPAAKQQQVACALPVVGDTVALHDAVDTSSLTTATLGGALPNVETTFSFGDSAATTLTGARQRIASRYTPKCKDANDASSGKCIQGIVVVSDACCLFTELLHQLPCRLLYTDIYISLFRSHLRSQTRCRRPRPTLGTLSTC